MSSLLDLVAGSLDSNAIHELSSQIGASPQQTASATQAALPLLLGALQRNTSSSQGAASLASALDRNHDGSVLDDVAGFFATPATDADERSVGHIFGAKSDTVTSALSRKSGLSGGQILQLLAQLAPLVLGALARARRSPSANPGASTSGGGLGDLLGGALGRMQGSNPGLGGLLGGLLDSDGDGSSVDDLLGSLMRGGQGGEAGSQGGGLGGDLGGLLGGLLGGKR